MRALRVLAVLALLLFGVLFVADLLVTRTLEGRIAQRVTAELEAPATVELRGWPVTLGLVRGEIAEVFVQAADVPLDGSQARLTELRATLPEVPVNLGMLTRVPPQLPLGRPGSFTADLSQAEVNALVPVPGLQVELLDGRARLRLPGLGAPVEASARLEGRRIAIRSSQRILGVDANFALAPPQLPRGARLERVQILPGILRLEGAVSSVPLAGTA